jgi:hypothetical protein
MEIVSGVRSPPKLVATRFYIIITIIRTGLLDAERAFIRIAMSNDNTDMADTDPASESVAWLERLIKKEV